MGLDRVNWTLVAEIATALTVLATELTRTEKAEVDGTILARV